MFVFYLLFSCCSALFMCKFEVAVAIKNFFREYAEFIGNRKNALLIAVSSALITHLIFQNWTTPKNPYLEKLKLVFKLFTC